MTTKKLNVPVSNRDALLDVIMSIPGKWAHTAKDVADSAALAEKRLDQMCMPKGLRKGVIARHTTKGPAAAAYRYSVKGSIVTLRRAADGWRVIEFAEASVFPGRGGDLRLYVSQEQDAQATQAMRRACGVTVTVESASAQ